MAVTSRVSSLGLFRKRVRGEKMSLLRQPMGGRRGLVDSRCSLHTATHSQTVLEIYQQTELYRMVIITAVTYLAPYLADEGELTALYISDVSVAALRFPAESA